MATIEVTDTIELPCPAQQAWAVLADYSHDVRWRSGVPSMAAEPSGIVGRAQPSVPTVLGSSG